LRAAQSNSSQNPISKNIQNKMDWNCASSGRTSTLKCEALSTNLSATKINKKIQGLWTFEPQSVDCKAFPGQSLYLTHFAPSTKLDP
jgi:hypothetical protein